jgi:hypothetical protein
MHIQGPLFKIQIFKKSIPPNPKPPNYGISTGPSHSLTRSKKNDAWADRILALHTCQDQKTWGWLNKQRHGRHFKSLCCKAGAARNRIIAHQPAPSQMRRVYFQMRSRQSIHMLNFEYDDIKMGNKYLAAISWTLYLSTESISRPPPPPISSDYPFRRIQNEAAHNRSMHCTYTVQQFIQNQKQKPFQHLLLTGVGFNKSWLTTFCRRYRSRDLGNLRRIKTSALSRMKNNVTPHDITQR